jgi:hypothetical protein
MPLNPNNIPHALASLLTNGAVGWNAAREGLYAPMESYAPPRLSLAAPTYASLAWRTRPLNAANYVQLGARPYDFGRRAFLSADPLGHGSDPALNTAFGGNPAAYFDADGRFGKQVFAYGSGFVEGGLQGLGNEFVGVGKFAKGMTYDLGRQISLTGFDTYEAYAGGDNFESAIFRGTYNMSLNGATTGGIAREAALQASGYRFGNQIYNNLEYGNATGDYSQFSQNMGVVAAIAAGPKMMQGAASINLQMPGSIASVHPGAAAAGSSALSQASILRALRANGSPEALATSKLISRGRLNLGVVATDPLGQGAAGRYFFGTRDIVIASDAAGSPMNAAGFTAHEARHFLQGITANTYGRIHEFDAYFWQRAADNSFNLSDEAIWQHIRNHPIYRYVPE